MHLCVQIHSVLLSRFVDIVKSPSNCLCEHGQSKNFAVFGQLHAVLRGRLPAPFLLALSPDVLLSFLHVQHSVKATSQ